MLVLNNKKAIMKSKKSEANCAAGDIKKTTITFIKFGAKDKVIHFISLTFQERRIYTISVTHNMFEI